MYGYQTERDIPILAGLHNLYYTTSQLIKFESSSILDNAHEHQTYYSGQNKSAPRCFEWVIAKETYLSI